jgi:hypothetical protein
MSGRLSVGSSKDAVVSILAALREKPKKEPSKNSSPITSSSVLSSANSGKLLGALAGGLSVYSLVEGQAGFDQEILEWKPELSGGSAAYRIRTASNSLISLRDADGRCVGLIVVEGEGESAKVTQVVHPRGYAGLMSAALGRCLSENNIGLGRFSQTFGCLTNADGDLVFMDAPVDRLDMVEEVFLCLSHKAHLPKLISSTADFVITDTEVESNGTRVDVKGRFGLINVSGVNLNNQIYVGSDLMLEMSDVSKLPEKFYVGRDLDVSHTPLRELPDSFHLGRSLIAQGSSLSKLKGGFSVKGDLNLQDCPIASLPWGLEVGGDLNLSGTSVSEVPGGTIVRGDLKIDDHMHVPTSVRLSGRILYSRAYGFETAIRSVN